MAPQLAATWGEGTPVLLLHGSLVTDPVQHWAALRPLGDRFQLRVAVRAGYGDNPAPPFASMDECVAEAVTLLGEGAHLVGHSYGGLIAMCAAASRPDLIKSLTIVEAPAWAVARGEGAVARLVERMMPGWRSPTPEAFIRALAKGLTDQDLPADFEPAPPQRRGIVATMTEPAPWDVTVPVQALAAAAFPKLVITGGWHAAFELVGERLATRIGAGRQVLSGRDHGVQSLGEPFNHALASLIDQAWMTPIGDKSTWDEQARAIVRRGYPEVASLLPDLVAWLQDLNWPGALTIAEFLVSIGAPVLPHIKAVLASQDRIWQYWIITEVVVHLEPDVVATLVPELKALAMQDDEDGAGDAARRLLEEHGLPADERTP
jgi:pimeloyl-ACP methyl ester carboxylesterase